MKKDIENGFRSKVTGAVRVDDKNDGGLAERLEKLETASQTWKKRIEPSDAVQFSVAGKIASTLPSTPTTPKLQPSSPLSERKKRGPCPSRFRSKNSMIFSCDSAMMVICDPDRGNGHPRQNVTRA